MKLESSMADILKLESKKTLKLNTELGVVCGLCFSREGGGFCFSNSFSKCSENEQQKGSTTSDRNVCLSGPVHLLTLLLYAATIDYGHGNYSIWIRSAEHCSNDGV